MGALSIMTLLHRFIRAKKGIGTVFGMVFFILIVAIVFASFIIILNQNTGLEQTTAQAKQMDLDRYTELQTVSVTNPETAVLNNTVYLTCSVTDNGTLPTELVRLWIKDLTSGTVGNVLVNPVITLQPGGSTYYFNSIKVANSSNYDKFIFWFISERGNSISAYPSINQFNAITPTGSFPGVTNVNSTYTGNQTPLQLSLTTTQVNQLIYVVVSYDDGNTLYTPTSTPSLTWTLRGQSSTTAQYNGDSILKTFYAIMPTIGPITINIQSTADELQDYYCSAMAFAVSGVNTTSPFDGSAQNAIGQSTMPTDTITTNYPNDLVIGALGIDNLNPVISPGPGFGQIMPVQSSYGASGLDNAMPRSVWSEWNIVVNQTTNLPVNCTFTSTNPWALITDAVKLVIIPPVAPVTLSPTSGPVGQLVTVSGQGFAPNSHLGVIFNGTDIPFNFITTSTGAIPAGATFTVPQGAALGNNTVVITDNSFNYYSNNFAVTTPSIIVSPQSGSSGIIVGVTGSNFIANSTIAITFDGNTTVTTPSTITATSTGSFSSTFSAADTAGIKPVVVSDGVNSVTANFTIVPSVTPITPTSGPQGTIVTFGGAGFAANSDINVFVGGTFAQTVPVNLGTNSNGSFSGSFIVPFSSAGSQTVNITDANGNFNSSQTFTVTIPTITVSPNTGTVGQTVSITGSNFVTSSSINITFDGALFVQTAATSSGQFSGASFQIPASITGSHIIKVVDSSNNSINATFTVSPSLTLNPTSGIVGSSFTIASNGFAATSTVNLSFGGSQISTNPSTLTTGSTGSFSATCVVPNATGGNQTVTATDSSTNHNSASTLFRVDEQITITSNPTGSGYVTVDGTPYSTPQTFIWIAGSQHTLVANSPVGTSGSRYVYSSWNDTGSITHTYTVPTSPSTVVASFTLQYQITMASNFGSLSPSNSSWYNAGSAVTIYAVSPSIVAGEQYIWNGWTGSGTGSYTGSGNNTSLVTMNGPISETATWTHQFTLTMAANFGTFSPASGNWYNAGTQVTIYTVSPSVGAGEQYVWNGWTGSGTGSYTGIGNNTSLVTMNGPITETATWTHQWQLTFQQNGLSNDALGTVLTIGSNATTYSQLPQTGIWVNASTTYSFTTTITAGTGKQYALTSISGPVSPLTSSGTVMGNYVTQYQLTMATNFGTTSPTSGSWYNSGSSVTIYATSPSVGNGERYTWNGWTGSGSGSYSGTGNNSALVTMNGAVTETASWTHQYSFTLSYLIVGGGSPTAPTFTANLNGASNPQVLTTTATGYWFDAGSPWAITNPLSSTGSEQWSTHQSASGTVTASTTIGFIYYNQYSVTPYFTVSDSSTPTVTNIVSFKQYGSTITTTPTKGDSGGTVVWIDAGSSVTYSSPITGATGERWQVTSADTRNIHSNPSVSSSGTATAGYTTSIR